MSVLSADLMIIPMKHYILFTCSLFVIGITPDQTTVYAEFYHGLLPQTTVYCGLGVGYSYSDMTNYFKLNNYWKF